jgi:hypothetical protein
MNVYLVLLIQELISVVVAFSTECMANRVIFTPTFADASYTTITDGGHDI